jgi:Short C-terminal domain
MPFFHHQERKEADATVSQVTMLKRVNYGTALVRVVYTVHPITGSDFEATREAKVSMATLPQAGHRVRVSYDPDKPQKLEILTPPGEETGTVTAATVEIPYFNTANPIQAQVTHLQARVRDLAREEHPSVLDQLKQLGELRDSGVLTDSEFEAQKAKILAES